MPLYEYQCKNCDTVTEFLMKMSDPDPESCPSCTQGPMFKLMSTTAFQLKGGGWYSEGYSKGGSSKPAASTSEASSTSSTASASSSHSGASHSCASCPSKPDK